MCTSANMEEAGFMTYTAASHQEAIKMILPHCWGSCHVNCKRQTTPLQVENSPFTPFSNTCLIMTGCT